MESPVLIPDVMDSHMHLDRSLRRLRLDPSTGIQEFLTQRPAPAPKQQINLVGVRGLPTESPLLIPLGTNPWVPPALQP
jgi:hypothetical protein